MLAKESPEFIARCAAYAKADRLTEEILLNDAIEGGKKGFGISIAIHLLARLLNNG